MLRRRSLSTIARYIRGRHHPNHYLGVGQRIYLDVNLWIPQIDQRTLRRQSSTIPKSSNSTDHLDEALSSLNLQLAQKILNELIDLGSPDLGELRGRVLDGWLECHEKQWSDNPIPDREKLKELVLAVSKAHSLLENMDSRLSNAYPLSEWPKSSNHNQIGGTKEEAVMLNKRCRGILQAWARTSKSGETLMGSRITRAIPQRAQFLLDRMQQEFLLHRDEEAGNNNMLPIESPTVTDYNNVLQAWAYSKEHLRGAMAEQVFERLVQLGEPNGETYRLIILAWAKSGGERRHAFTATKHLLKMLRRLENTEDTQYEPRLCDYHRVLEAWTHAEDLRSPGKAQNVLRALETAYENGTTRVQPDVRCFRHVLVTASKRPMLEDLGTTLVDPILERMKQLYLVPDSDCYTAAIRTWKNVACNEDCDMRDWAVKRCLDLLDEVTNAQGRTVNVMVIPATENYNDALEALGASRNPHRTEQTDKLLQSLEHHNTLKPDVDSYRFALQVWESSRRNDQVENATLILDRFISQAKREMDGSLNKNAVRVFNSFIRVCSSYRPSSETEGIRLVRQCLAAVEKMRHCPNALPDSSTYALLLQACRRLLGSGTDRQVFVKRIFGLACEKGLVDEFVLQEFRRVSTTEQYTSIVFGQAEEVEGLLVVPEAWTINTLGGRVCTEDGRRAPPLGVHGKVQVTMAMQDFKMRKIRDGRSRNLLRGGRLTMDERKRIAKTGTV